MKLHLTTNEGLLLGTYLITKDGQEENDEIDLNEILAWMKEKRQDAHIWRAFYYVATDIGLSYIDNKED